MSSSDGAVTGKRQYWLYLRLRGRLRLHDLTESATQFILPSSKGSKKIRCIKANGAWRFDQHRGVTAVRSSPDDLRNSL
jgi:hypothetical protein